MYFSACRKSSNEPVFQNVQKLCASAGNRTRAARVAGEHSTTEPPMLTAKTFLDVFDHSSFQIYNWYCTNIKTIDVDIRA